MELQTIVGIDKPVFQLDYTTPMLLVGSCFVENIGQKLEYFRFPVDINPCGIVYNPVSVAETLSLLMDRKPFTAEDLLSCRGKWVSLSHHDCFSDIDPERCLRNINSRLEFSAQGLRTAKVLVITWGTAWVYRHIPTGKIVSNCHKLPATEFERFRLEPEEIVKLYKALLSRLWEFNSELQVVFTVSPIRHWKDGAHGNQVSKAVLLLALERLRQHSKQIGYFPSYEIVMDELRDYRFYADDMLHISEKALEYVWEKFKENFISPSVYPLMARVGKIQKGLAHRPFDAEGEEFRNFRLKLQQEWEKLKSVYPYLKDL